jgi:ParB family chromosome partitioning protein
VRKEDGQYVLIAGERRLRAAGLAGLTEVPVVVREADARVEQLELALIENLQRSDLDPIETARGYERLIEDFGLSQDDVARRVGRDRATVANAVRLLKLPEFALQVLREGRITAGHARAILPVENHDDLRGVLGKVLAQQLSVRATEALVQKVLKTPKSVRQEREKRERAYDYATKLLSEALHAPVEIKPKPKGGGTIVVNYGDAEDLERIIELLRK